MTKHWLVVLDVKDDLVVLDVKDAEAEEALTSDEIRAVFDKVDLPSGVSFEIVSVREC